MKAQTRKAIYSFGPLMLVAAIMALAGCSTNAPEQPHQQEENSYESERESAVEVHENIERRFVEHTFYLRDGRAVTCLVNDSYLSSGSAISCDWPEKE